MLSENSNWLPKVSMYNNTDLPATRSYLSVLSVSSKLMSAGLSAAIIAVLEFPPVLEK